ncbi:hypothetical protein SAMN05443582_107186 [Phyllobacterium sp. OV277]|nr:hypothetical protein SAMN05443582_107186 [Phyllobacterium sp. OV277]
MRTKLSNWVYRIGSSAFVITTIYAIRVVLRAANEITTQSPGLVDPQHVTITALTGTIGLVCATAAMLLRSGAVIWLLPIYWLSATASLAFVSRDSLGAMVVAGVVIIVPLLIVLPILFWLVKRDEIRRP